MANVKKSTSDTRETIEPTSVAQPEVKSTTLESVDNVSEWSGLLFH